MKTIYFLFVSIISFILFSFNGCTEDKDPAACNPTLRDITVVDWLANIQNYNYQGVFTHNITRSTLETEVYFIHTRVRPEAFGPQPAQLPNYPLAPAVQTTYYDCMGTLIDKANRLNYTDLMLSADVEVMYQNSEVQQFNVNTCNTNYTNISDAPFLYDIAYGQSYDPNPENGNTLKIQNLDRVNFEGYTFYVARYLDMNPGALCGHKSETYKVFTCNGLFYGSYNCSAGTGPGNVGEIVNSSELEVELI